MVKLIVMARDEGSAVIMVTHDEALVKALDARSINVRGGECRWRNGWKPSRWIVSRKTWPVWIATSCVLMLG
nr:hypothetical protein [Bifidobacterium dentium]